MTTEDDLLLEIKKLNRKLSFLNHPLRTAWFNFLSGVFRSLGSLFGTVVLAAVIVYVLSQFNITQYFQEYFKSLIPTPAIQFDLPQLNPNL